MGKEIKLQAQTRFQSGLLVNNWTGSTMPAAAVQKSVIGNSTPLGRCLNLALKAAAENANVLIHGETGTGKDLFARLIHDHSGRRNYRFDVLDCRAPEQTSIVAAFDREGAPQQFHSDLLARADRGTLYLDEIGDLSLARQKTLCSLLQSGSYRIGLIAASQQRLEKLARQGRFRNDLLDILQNIRIDLPALRERPEDIVELTRYYLDRFSLWNGISAKNITPEFNAMLLRYPWPGNVRELVNTVEQSLLTAKFEKTLFPKHLPSRIRVQVTRSLILQQIDFSPVAPRHS